VSRRRLAPDYLRRNGDPNVADVPLVIDWLCDVCWERDDKRVVVGRLGHNVGVRVNRPGGVDPDPPDPELEDELRRLRRIQEASRSVDQLALDAAEMMQRRLQRGESPFFHMVDRRGHLTLDRSGGGLGRVVGVCSVCKHRGIRFAPSVQVATIVDDFEQMRLAGEPKRTIQPT
jgi:hypothetical protein